MQLSKNFTLEELQVSATALRKDIENVATPDAIKNLEALCAHVLQPLRELLQKPIKILSGYRSPEVNDLVGGAHGSQHVKGQAADITVEGMTAQELFEFIDRNIAYDQLIQEFNEWVHVSWTIPPREQKLIATKVNGKTVYNKA